MSGFDSNFHSDVPSSLTSFHHRNPTNKRPVTFFTVQKSAATDNITKTNTITKLSENQLPKQ